MAKTDWRLLISRRQALRDHRSGSLGLGRLGEGGRCMTALHAGRPWRSVVAPCHGFPRSLGVLAGFDDDHGCGDRARVGRGWSSEMTMTFIWAVTAWRSLLAVDDRECQVLDIPRPASWRVRVHFCSSLFVVALGL